MASRSSGVLTFSIIALHDKLLGHLQIGKLDVLVINDLHETYIILEF